LASASRTARRLSREAEKKGSSSTKNVTSKRTIASKGIPGKRKGWSSNSSGYAVITACQGNKKKPGLQAVYA